MHNWKRVNLSKMAALNISLSLNERQSSSNKEHNKSLRLVLFIPFRRCFTSSLEFSLSTVKQTKLFHSISEMFFTFLAKKTFLIECVWSGAASYNKRREFWRETHTPLWLLIGPIIFLTREKTSFAILTGRIIFFTCEKHRSLLWLARTNLRMKIYDIAFWWVFLSMYIINMYIFHQTIMWPVCWRGSKPNISSKELVHHSDKGIAFYGSTLKSFYGVQVICSNLTSLNIPVSKPQ